jgi:hypothetical protein
MNAIQFGLSTFLIAIISLSNAGQAQSRPSWAREYRGEMSFELREDNKLDQLQIQARTSARQLQVAKQKVNEKQAEVQKISEQIKKIQIALNKLSQSIAQNVTLKTKTKKQIQKLQEALKTQERQLELAQSARENVAQTVQALKKRESNQSQRLNAKKEECQNTPSDQCQKQVQAITKQLEKTQGELKEKNDLLKDALADVQVKKERVDKTKKSIQDSTQNIANIEKENEKKSNQLVAKRNVKKQLSPKLSSAKEELRPMVQREQKAQQRSSEFQNRFQAYRTDLIKAVLRANNRGFREGQGSGHYDGEEIAQERGKYYGRENGSQDGQSDGIRDGRLRAYQAGEQQGLQAGAAQAQTDGERDGTAQGTEQGFKDAAQLEGEVAGERRAKASDAAQVGIDQGQKDGLVRAQRTGQDIGTQEGEQKAIKEQESKSLSSKKVEGAFAGAFSRNVPSFPAGYRGPRANSGRTGHRRDVVQKAFSDGYHYGYRVELRLTYEEQIGTFYNRSYDSSYERSYQEFASRAYDSDFAQGQNDGYNQAYDQTYSTVRDQFFASARAQAAQNPNRQSPAYQQTYQEVESQTFQRVYESIRQQNYKIAEQKSFDNNIEEQTQIFRQKSYAKVNDIYENQAVLKFSKATIKDTGVNSVASQDGIYQPGESVTFDVELVNYGQKAADSVVVMLDSGEKVTLPAIPAQSQTRIMGAIQTQVQTKSRANQNFLNSVTTFYKLSAQSSIQGRHYSNTSNSQINAGERFKKTISYPLALSSLKSTEQIIFKERTAFQVNLKNNSERAYEGELKITLTTNAKNGSVVKEFSNVQQLKDSVQLSDAQVYIDQESDVYTALNFSVEVSKNGVTLGQSTQAFKTMAKIPYSENGSNLIMANSDISSTQLLDLINDFNGVQNISILDTSLPKQNQRVLSSGLKNKTLLVLERGALGQNIDRMLGRSQNISLVMVDDQNQGLKSLKSLTTFKKALNIRLKLSNIGQVDFLFASPLQNKGVKEHYAAIQANLKNYSRLLNAAELLRAGTSEYIKKVKATINAENFFAPTVHQTQLLEVMNIHILKEVGTVTKAYLASGGGLFGGGRDKDIAELVKEDDNMFHNQLIEATDRNVKNSNVGLALAGLDSYRVAKMAFEDHDSLSDQLSTTAVNNRLFGAMFWNRGTYHDYDEDMEDEIDDYSSRVWRSFESTDAPRFAPF